MEQVRPRSFSFNKFYGAIVFRVWNPVVESLLVPKKKWSIYSKMSEDSWSRMTSRLRGMVDHSFRHEEVLISEMIALELSIYSGVLELPYSLDFDTVWIIICDTCFWKAYVSVFGAMFTFVTSRQRGMAVRNSAREDDGRVNVGCFLSFPSFLHLRTNVLFTNKELLKPHPCLWRHVNMEWPVGFWFKRTNNNSCDSCFPSISSDSDEADTSCWLSV